MPSVAEKKQSEIVHIWYLYLQIIILLKIQISLLQTTCNTRTKLLLPFCYPCVESCTVRSAAVLKVYELWFRPAWPWVARQHLESRSNLHEWRKTCEWAKVDRFSSMHIYLLYHKHAVHTRARQPLLFVELKCVWICAFFMAHQSSWRKRVIGGHKSSPRVDSGVWFVNCAIAAFHLPEIVWLRISPRWLH